MAKESTPAADDTLDLNELATKAEEEYRSLVTALAKGDQVDQDTLVAAGVKTGRSIGMVQTHRTRLEARLAAAEQLAGVDDLRPKIDQARAAAHKAEEAFEQAKQKAQQIVAEAHQLLEDAREAHSRLSNEVDTRTRNGTKTLQETADPHLERNRREILKETGFKRHLADRAERQNASLSEKQAKREMERVHARVSQVAELLLDPIAGMNWGD